MQILSESDKTSPMTKMLNDGHFLFIYNKDEIQTGEEDFAEPGQTVYNFFCNKIVTVNAQIYSQNFKTPSQPHAAYNSFFCL